MTIATMRTSLTQEDIRRLVRGDSPEDRADATAKICRRIDRVKLSPEDNESALQILGLLASDTALLVRQALAVTLRPSAKRHAGSDLHSGQMNILSRKEALSDSTT